MLFVTLLTPLTFAASLYAFSRSAALPCPVSVTIPSCTSMRRPVMLSPARFLRISVSMAVLSSGAGVTRFMFEQPIAETSAAESTSDANAFFIYVNLRWRIEQLVFQNGGWGVGGGEWGVGSGE